MQPLSRARYCHSGRTARFRDARHRSGAALALYRMRRAGCGFRRDRGAAVKRTARARPPRAPKRQAGVAFAKSCFAPRADSGLNLGLGPWLPMPRGRQLGTARWRHAKTHPPAKLTTKRSLARHSARGKSTSEKVRGRNRITGNRSARSRPLAPLRHHPTDRDCQRCPEGSHKSAFPPADSLGA